MYTQLVALLGLLVSFTLATCNDVTTKRITTQDGTGYTYDYVPAQQGKSTLLLIHGFPSTRHDWHNQVADLSAAGYGVLVPDCLGYGDSDMPLEVQAYNMKRMVGHLTEMLDEESLDTVIGVGHDWGSSILSRMAIWHRDRLDKLAFLSVGYLAPGTLLDIDAINAAAVETYGYAQYGYFYFFYNYDSGAIARDHVRIV
jgi:pimeloyl-ACP methyl ester carboxylesterase